MTRSSTNPSKRTKSRPKRKSSKPLSPWNIAMAKATRILKEQDPLLHGPALFKKGAVVAHELIEKEKIQKTKKEEE